VSGDDGVSVAFDQRDEVLDRGLTGASRAVAPAAQAFERRVEMLVV